MNRPRISVIIPTRNRATCLEWVLPSYAQESVREIIVVDDCSTDDTQSRLEQFGGKVGGVSLRVLRHNQRRLQQAAKNAGIEAAEGDILLFGEDDVYLLPGYVAALLAIVGEDSSKAACGRWVNLFSATLPSPVPSPRESPPTDPALLWDFGSYKRRYEDNDMLERVYLGPVLTPLSSPIFAVRRESLGALRFDPSYRGNAFREETDLIYQIREQGVSFTLVSDAVCYHYKGVMNGTGGARMNRLVYEYWCHVNTWRFLHLHWTQLSADFGLRGGPLVQSALYSARRATAMLAKILRRRH